MKKHWLAVFALGAALQFAALAAKASHISAVPPNAPVERYQAQVFAAIEAARWKTAYALAARTNDKVLGKLVAWIDYTQLGSRARFADIAAFMEQNPHWPDQHILQRNAEEALADSIPAATVIDWFSRRRPLTVRGRMRLAQALLDSGETEEARTLLRETWVEGNFPRLRERYFLKRYRKFLRQADHAGRLDRLLWAGRTWEARRMLRRVDAGQRALAVARIRLRRFRGGVDWAIRQVPKALTENLGLVYERLRWRRRKGRDADARALLDSLPPALTRPPEIWWRERGVLARRALRGGEISTAYALASAHRQKRGKNFAEAEWLAGWISLRFLDDAEVALKHFSALHANVKYPISLARGAYWAGRAAEAIGDAQQAMSFYSAAAPHATTYYGQLAAARIGKVDGYLPQELKPDEQEILAFNKGELVRIVRLLGELGDRDHLRTFVLHLSANATTPGQSALVAALALEQERPDLAVLVAKRSRGNGFALIPHGYPMVSLPDGGGPEPALLLAVIRQESAFDPEAVSHAGARGLMQLMPSTAKTTAKELKVKYSRSNLTTDPDYNIKLGSAHLAHLLDQFNGSYVLALGAYNAGAPRVRQWLAAHGDPRSAEVDVINWIEMIPLAETRNFVQRVLEALRIYRQRLDGTQITQSIESDLERARHSGAAETTSQPCDAKDEEAVRSSLTAC